MTPGFTPAMLTAPRRIVTCAVSPDSQRLYRSSNLKIVAYILMLIGSAGAIVFACYVTVMAGVGLHAFNSDAFEHKLNEVERTGIVQTATQLMSVQVGLLIATNVLWAAGVGIALWQARRRYNPPLHRTGPAV